VLVEVIAVTLPDGPQSASAARKLLAAALADAGCPRELIDQVVLVASELVTNVVLHGHGPPRVRLVPLRPGVRLEVRDGSPRRPRQRAAPAGDPHGRGLLIVSAYADRWGTRRDVNGKCVWAEFRVSQPGMCRTSGNETPGASGATVPVVHPVAYPVVTSLDRYRPRRRPQSATERHRSTG
jgi:anti-sigma regulatory factor (Ser/Thr protein kinase)